MQRLRMLGGMALVLALAATASAQTTLDTLYTATVSAAEAEVRSGPSTNPDLYATNKLRQGEKVEVVKELEGGWLMIKPPPGSFSWINMRFLEQGKENRTTWAVVIPPGDRVPVLYGSALRDAKPSVEGAKVQRGTLLSSIGPARSAEDGMWLPIDPPPGEARYVRADSVSKSAPVQPVSAVAPAGGQPAVVSAVPANYSAPTVAAPAGDPRWLQAQQLEQAGNRAEAIRLYEELGRAVHNSDPDLMGRAFGRAQALRNQGGAAAPVRTASGQTTYPIPSADTRLQAVPASLQVPSPPSPCVPCQTQTTASSPGNLQRSGPGWLRRSAWWLDGQPTYSLLNSQGQVRMYVTAQPGLDLEQHLNRNVELFGPIVYRGYPPVYHIKAAQVAPVQ